MAIRCNELNIPAAIGVGEKKFNEIKSLNVLRLNCENKKIEKNMRIKIAIIPTIREVYKDQFEFSIDLKWTVFLKKIFFEMSYKNYDTK